MPLLLATCHPLLPSLTLLGYCCLPLLAQVTYSTDLLIFWLLISSTLIGKVIALNFPLQLLLNLKSYFSCSYNFIPRFWCVLSLGLLLELLLDCSNLLPARPHLSTCSTLLKVTLLLWCLAPGQHNGSDVTFSALLVPASNLSKDLCGFARRLAPLAFEKTLEYAEELVDLLEYVIEAVMCKACKVSDVIFRGLRDVICSEIFKRTALAFARRIKRFGARTKDIVFSSPRMPADSSKHWAVSALLGGHSQQAGAGAGSRSRHWLVSALLGAGGQQEERTPRLISDWIRAWWSN